nr:MAG TPA: hypothetical protein [Caudoviricetes sp.]
MRERVRISEPNRIYCIWTYWYVHRLSQYHSLQLCV